MILLDTCALLWLASDSPELSEAARAAIREHSGMLGCSAISFWEIGLKQAKGRLKLPLALGEWIDRVLARHGIDVLPVGTRFAVSAAELPPIHADPADRFIVATAMATGRTILTPDTHIRDYPDVRVIW